VWVRADADVALVGGAIAARVRQAGHAEVRSVGNKATYRAAKSLINAGEYLASDKETPKDQVLALRVATYIEPQGRENSRPGEEAMAKVFSFEARPSLVKTSSTARVLLIGAQTNAGKAAAAIAGEFRSGKDAGGSVTLRAMGAASVRQALSAVVIAQKYLEREELNQPLVVVPSFADYHEEAKEESVSSTKRQFVLHVVTDDLNS
jgi:stage V sporulation protein SpoVS